MEFKLKNPNKSLITYGYSLFAILIIALLLDNSGIATMNLTSFIIGIGVIVKILVLLWVPKAASSTGRNAIGWTIICLVSPSIGLIVLGTMGIKYTHGIIELEKEYADKFNDQKKLLTKSISNNEIDENEYYSRLNQVLSDLREEAYELMPGIMNAEDSAFLTEQLKNRGYVLEDDPDVFVSVDDKCPACGAIVKESDKECPDCGLAL